MIETLGSLILLIGATALPILAVVIAVRDAIDRGRLIAWDIAAIALIMLGGFFFAIVFVLARDLSRSQSRRRQRKAAARASEIRTGAAGPAHAHQDPQS